MKIQEITGKELFKFYNRTDTDKIEKDKIFFLVESLGQKLIFDNIPKNKFCFVVLKNADFTEGRGPMLVHKIFRNIDKAVGYIMQQGGIYGSQQYHQNYLGINIYNEPYCISCFNGYDIKLVEIE